uniref:Protein kinase domain-containing protein n=1 Tax=Knipowitschia caucasica TaxID=637954 RepID=A0AAV2KVY5_KNICA
MALPRGAGVPVVRREHLGGEWQEVGRGGFGRVYRARHKDLRMDVAVKVLNDNASHFVFKEASFMDLASNEFVLRVLGTYKGPGGERGLVTEYMRRGSIESLQKALSGPPPWPLAFRLAHQIALAMDFLHHKNFVHLDLKPNNILLNDTLNARLADFGLSTVSRSVEMNSTNMQTGPRGTYPYMPPEAFDAKYEPVRAFDLYSYGILLWSIFTGREPYQGALFSLVELRITEGDRPRCEDLLGLQVVGISDLVSLMKNCWDKDPHKRPHFKDCLKITERLFPEHSNGIQRAITEVLARLESSNQQGITKLNDVEGQRSVCDGASLSISGETMSRKAEFVDHHKPTIIQRVSNALAIAEELGSKVHSEIYCNIRAKKTNQDRVRELYCTTLRSGGERVKAAFYDALKKHEFDLMQDLEN